MFSSKKRFALSLHHEDDSVYQNGSVGQKTDVNGPPLTAGKVLGKENLPKCIRPVGWR